MVKVKCLMGYGLWVMGYGLWVKMLITSNDALRRHRCVKENLLDRTEKSKALPAASRHALVIPEYVPGESLAPPPQATVAAG